METLHLFSNSRAIKHFFAHNYAENFLPNTKSIAEFLDFILRVDKKRKVPSFLRNFYLYQAVQINYQHTQKLGDFAKNFTQFLLNSTFFFKFYDELSAECVSIDSLEKLDIYAFYDDHLKLLKIIFKSYQEILNKNKFFDKYFLEDYKITFELLNGFNEIIVYLEGFLSQFEMRVFRKIAKHLPVIFRLSLDSFNQDYYQRLFGLSLGLGFYQIVLFCDKFSLNDRGLQNISENRQSLIQVLEFKDKVAEVGGIFAQIDSWLKQGIMPEQICIILPNEEFAKYLKLFDKARNFNYAMGNTLKESALFRNLNNSLKEKIKYNAKGSLNLKQEYIPNVGKGSLQDSTLMCIPEFKNFDAFKDFLENLETNSKESQDIKEKFLEGLEHFSFALNHLCSLNVQEKILTFLKMIEEVKIDDIGGGRINVMGILETRGICFDYIIIPEFNVENVPSFNEKDFFLNTAIREKVGLPTQKSRENLQKHYYAQILQKSREAWIMCLNNEETKPSHFLLEDSIFGNIPIFKASLQYSEYFLNGKALNYKEREIIAPLRVKFFSATSLQCFLNCKRKYYYRYILGFQGIETKTINLGNKIHQILNEVYKNTQDYPMDLMYQEVCTKLSKSSTTQEFFESALAKKYLKNFFEFEKKRLKEGWIPLVLEQEFSFKLFSFELKGRIDRIDKKQDEVYVLDYKYKRNLKVESKNYEKATDFQLPLYALALQEGAIESLGEFSRIFAGFYDLYNTKILYEHDLNAKIEVLKEKLEIIKRDSKAINFTLTPRRDICRYCDFIYLCNRY